MSKLLEWIGGLTAFLAVWYSVLTTKSKFTEDYRHFIALLPVILVGLLGVYAVVTVLWRVFTFNDCPEAAEELQKQISQARADLKKKKLEL